MAYCSRCGNQMRDAAKFCDSCGAPIAGMPPISYQPQVSEGVVRRRERFKRLFYSLAIISLSLSILFFLIEGSNLTIIFIGVVLALFLAGIGLLFHYAGKPFTVGKIFVIVLMILAGIQLFQMLLAAILYLMVMG